MTPLHLADAVAHLRATVKSDVAVFKESGHVFNDRELDWCLAEIHRNAHFFLEALQEFEGALERLHHHKNKGNPVAD